ncbi:heavy-metal-associated domain-containing protein [Terrabacter sp. 2YAF2]|uniref:heavy-metal-associated domain-containing protein n=1 Tax=Terrabacter sp. 2YAF2 TaxID=3233026 RepID=UPI003F9CCD25
MNQSDTAPNTRPTIPPTPTWTGTTPEEAPMSQTVHTEITVAGMTCGHCSAAVTEELTALPGVTDAAVDLHPGEDSPVTITSEAPLDRAAVDAAVTEAGYSLR